MDFKRGVFFFWVGFFILITPPSVSGSSGSSAAFLKVQPSARLGSMRAGSALRGEAFGNPAGIHFDESKKIDFNYLSWIGNFSQYSPSYQYQLGEDGNIVGTMRYFSINDRERFAPDISTGDGSANYGSSFTNSSVSLALYYCRGVDLFPGGKPVYYSFGWKGIREELHDKSATALAFDASLFYKFSDSPFQIGLVAKNFGTKMKFAKKAEELPQKLRGGGAYFFNLIGHQSILAYDLEYNVNEKSVKNSFGLEFELTPKVHIRTGYSKISKREIDGNISFGFGVTHGNMKFEYAFSPGDSLRNQNILSISYSI